jgi:hypothetical protein
MSNDSSKLPRWAQDRIAALEGELRRWQDLYVGLSRDMARKDPSFAPLIPPVDIKVFPPGPRPPQEMPFPPGVYAYMTPFPPSTSSIGQAVTEGSSEIVLPGLTNRTPTDREP